MLGRADREAQLCHKISALSPSARTEIRRHLERILDDPVFRGSRRCHRLLQYVVEKALEEKFEELKERILGIEVFGRQAQYDTQADSIVRVTANEVRKRLAQFYVESALDSPVRIELPAGSYIPEFQLSQRPAEHEPAPQPAETSAAPPDSAPRPVPSPVSADTADVSEERRRRRLLVLIASVILGLCLLAIGGLWQQNVELRRNAWIASETHATSLPWSALLSGSEKPVYVVLADVAVGTSQELLRRSLSLQEYIRGDFLKSPAAASKEALELAQMMARRPYTSAADAGIAARLLKLDPNLNRRLTVRFARDLKIQDLNESNAIFLGAGYANLWERLTQPSSNFRIEFVQAAGMHVCVNHAPKPGEPEKYVPAGPTGTAGVAYAVVALLPGPREGGHVLLLAGTNTEGTLEAAEFVMHRQRFAEALKKIGVDPFGPVRHFEFLLKLNAVAGSSYHSEIANYRVSPALK
jgi:hypothetical protein